MTDLALILARVRLMARRYRATPLGADDAEGVGCLAVAEYAPQCSGDDLAGYVLERASWRMRDAHRKRCGRGGPAREVPVAELPHVGRRDDYFPLDCLCGLRPRVRRLALLAAAGYSRAELAAAEGVTTSRISQLLAEARPCP